MRSKLESLEVIPITPESWDKAYDIAFNLRRRGLTIPMVDLVIAAVAVENDLVILHHDRHYELIREHEPRLRTLLFQHTV